MNGIESYNNSLVYVVGSQTNQIYKLSIKKINLIKNEINETRKAEETFFYYPQMIKKNISDFKEYKRNEDKNNRNTKDLVQSISDSTNTLINLNGSILNILTSFRSYTDNVAHMISQQFGVDSSVFLYFKEKQKYLFDSNKSYRFMCRYRNYVQHVGLPIHDLVANEYYLKYYDKYDSVLIVKKSELLKYDGWGPVKQDFGLFDENINIYEIIIEFDQAIDLLHNYMVEYLYSNNIYDFNYLLTQYENAIKICGDKDIAVIAKKNQHEYTYHFFPKKFLETFNSFKRKT